MAVMKIINLAKDIRVDKFQEKKKSENNEQKM